MNFYACLTPVASSPLGPVEWRKVRAMEGESGGLSPK